jgi:alkylation response protein AidB-like acyl-CoA dehydrogenase
MPPLITSFGLTPKLPLAHQVGVGEPEVISGRRAVELGVLPAADPHWTAATRAGAGFPSRYESAVAKVFANEMALRVTDAALQVHGDSGRTRDLPAERYVRWARYGPLGAGTPQILGNGISRELLGRTDDDGAPAAGA